MIFALLHATLGWLLAALATIALRRRSADARGWAWRLGLIKGPLALLLAIPIVTPAFLPTTLKPNPVRPDIVLREVAPQVVPVPQAAPIGEARTEPAAGSEGAPSTTPTRTEKTSPIAIAPSAVAVPPRTPQRASAPSLPVTPLSALYIVGVVAVLGFRLAAARRVHPSMPRVVGVLRPQIVVPEELDPQCAAMARAHEEAHVRRHDPLWSLLADLVCAGLWFAPPVWLCARGMRAEAEAACDAAALQETGAARAVYARLLLAHAGSAPANALGGPARRLARRILMIEWNAQPLPRLASATLLALGGVALLPWRAVSAPVVSARTARNVANLFPFQVSLEDAMLATLNEPGVKAKVGWTPDQDAALAGRDARIAAAWKEFNDRQAVFMRTHSQRDANRLDDQERGSAKQKAVEAGGPIPWTPVQKGWLESLALARIGSTLWFDPEVSRHLGLTADQKHRLLVHERSILDRLYLDPKLEKGYLPLPKSVERRAELIQYKLYIAVPKDRPALQKSLDALQYPYRKDVPHPTRMQQLAQRRADLAKMWRLLAESEPRTETILTNDQRKTLKALETDPSAWRDSESTRSKRFALAEPHKEPSHEVGFRIPAVRLPLEKAAKLMLQEPGVKAEVGWTAAQDEAVKAGVVRWQKVWDAFASELCARQKSVTLREASVWDSQERPKALARADAAAEPYPWTSKQKGMLRRLAFRRFGSAVWKDPEVESRLQLTLAQRMATEREDTKIARFVADSTAGSPVLQTKKPLPERLREEIAALEGRYLDAPPATRQALNKRIAELRGPYEPYYRDRRPAGGEPLEKILARTWALRVAADRKLELALSDDQRRTLNSLKGDPAAWSVPTKVTRTSRNEAVERPAALVGPGDLTQVVSASTSPLKSSPANPSHREEKVYPPRGARWYGLTIDGPPPGDEPGNVPIGVAHDPDGSTWTVYRARQSAPYTYALEYQSKDSPNWVPKKVMIDYRTLKSANILRSLRPIKLPATLHVDGQIWTIHPQTRTTLPPGPKLGPGPSFDASWIEQRGSKIYAGPGLKIEGQSPEALPVHVAQGELVRTFQAADGSTWKVFRERVEGAPNRYSVEHVPWTEASLRRALHLGGGEWLNFHADPKRPDWEIATLPDREGIATEHTVGRKRSTDGDYIYDLHSRTRRLFKPNSVP